MIGVIEKFRNSWRDYPFWEHLKTYRKRYVFGLLSLLVVDAINVALPLMVREVMDALAPKDFNRVLWAGGIYLLLMALQAVGRYLWRVYLIGTSHYIARDMRRKLYDHLQHLPLDYYQKVRTGDLMSRATNDIESVRMAVGPGILVTVDAAMVFCMIVPVMFWLSPKLTLLAFAFYPLVPFITKWLGEKIDVLFEESQKKMSNLSAMAQESFRAVRLIKSLVLEPSVESKFSTLSKELEGQGILLAKYQAAFSPTLTLLTSLGTLMILMLGGVDVIQGVITVGTFIAFQRFVVQLSWPMEAIGWAVTMNREGVAAQRRLNDVLNVSRVTPILLPDSRGWDGEKAKSPVLEVRNLEFTFKNGSASGFHLNLNNLVVGQGKKIGLVGPVASGKTSFFNLVLRLYEPPAGTIFLSGRDVLSIPLNEVRQSIASVEQQIFLFSEKITSNVVMGMDREVPFDLVDKAINASCVGQEVRELEKGFESRLGERGVNLSGGQKQRLALARALVRDPELLLLDDCFSAVDVEVEKRIIENFFAMYPHLSVIVASHRLSIMPHMDEIWLLAHGQVTERGTHAELMKKSVLYQELWEKSEKEIQLKTFEASAETEVVS